MSLWEKMAPHTMHTVFKTTLNETSLIVDGGSETMSINSILSLAVIIFNLSIQMHPSEEQQVHQMLAGAALTIVMIFHHW